MVSVALFYTAITLTIPEISLATNVVGLGSVGCEKIRCSTSSQCPPWHYCDTNQRFCQPCTRCIDGSDAAMRRGNCRDPMFCIDSLYARQDYDTACPRLGFADGYSGSIECKPCDGTFGNYLGTTCRANCTCRDWEVFSCIFLNEVAQWNVSRKPYWIVYETFSPPPPPSTTPATTPPTTPPTTPTTLPLPSQPPPPTVSSAVSHIEAVSAYHLEALAGIVAGTVLGVSVIVFLAVMLVVCMRRRKNSNISKGSEQHAKEQLLPEPADSAPSTPSGKIPEQNDDPSSLLDHSARLPVELGSSMTICSQTSLRSVHPLPTEDSDYNPCDSDGRQSLPYASFVKDHQPRRNHPGSSLSLLSLHSERTPVHCVQPQEHSAPLVAPPPAAGSSDSGHPPCRYSSSNSLHQETMRKSVMDLAGEGRREPIEQSQETSSGYPPRDSCQDLCTSYYE